jgi:hypothetical protein
MNLLHWHTLLLLLCILVHLFDPWRNAIAFAGVLMSVLLCLVIAMILEASDDVTKPLFMPGLACPING